MDQKDKNIEKLHKECQDQVFAKNEREKEIRLLKEQKKSLLKVKDSKNQDVIDELQRQIERDVEEIMKARAREA